MRLGGVQRFLEELQTLNDLQGVFSALDRQVAHLGFTHFAYFIQRPPDNKPLKQTLSSYPGEWLQHYKENDYYNLDPVMTAAAGQLLPYTWRSVSRDRHTTKKQRLVFDEAGEFGIKEGITVPIHGPQGGLATLSVSSDSSGQEINRFWETRKHDLHLIACYAHDAILRCVYQSANQRPEFLTQRERECLLWTARGKTTWAVGEVLSISEHTVLFHIRNAMRKLDVYSKHHAVVKAILLGHIFP